MDWGSGYESAPSFTERLGDDGAAVLRTPVDATRRMSGANMRETLRPRNSFLSADIASREHDER
jgi:hypothetical protein